MNNYKDLPIKISIVRRNLDDTVGCDTVADVTVKLLVPRNLVLGDVTDAEKKLDHFMHGVCMVISRAANIS